MRMPQQHGVESAPTMARQHEAAYTTLCLLRKMRIMHQTKVAYF